MAILPYKSPEKREQEEKIEEERQKLLSTILDTLEQVILEIIPLINWKGGETMVVTLIVNNLILGRMTWAQVPAVIKEKVKKALEDAGLGFLAE